MSMYSKIIDLQKLHQAWEQVRRNKPAAGVDDVTYDDFDQNHEQELKQLNIELVNHTYEVNPVKMVKLRKGEDKFREISLYSMRDKVVQASIASELNKRFDGSFSESVYAYRSDKSALVALSKVEEAVASGKFSVVCKTDIEAFFDEIDRTLLKRMLLDDIKEIDVVDLIIAELDTPVLGKEGSLIPRPCGIYQGASISPVLSNYYLREVDKALTEEDYWYGRYADDILILARDENQATELFTKLKGMLEDLRLKIKEEKTYIRPIVMGFDFLGYHFDEKGKSIPKKAEEKLETSLEDVWLTMIGKTIEERLIKGSQILNGWEQYYREEREIANIYEYAVVVYMMRHKEELVNLAPKRGKFRNNNKDICRFLLKVWTERNWYSYVLYEYEQYFDVDDEFNKVVDNEYYRELFILYSQLMKGETEDLLTELMQTYSDLEKFQQAEKVSRRLQALAENPVQVTCNAGDKDDISYDNKTIGFIEDLFVAREDMYSSEYLDGNNTRKSQNVAAHINDAVIKKHLLGSETIGSYLVRSNDTVKYAVFDVDICRRVLLENGNDTLPEYMQKAINYAGEIKRTLHDMGIRAYVEFSGFRGFHVWVIMSEWIPARYVYTFLELVKRKVGEPQEDGITLELFPAKNRKKTRY